MEEGQQQKEATFEGVARSIDRSFVACSPSLALSSCCCCFLLGPSSIATMQACPTLSAKKLFVSQLDQLALIDTTVSPQKFRWRSHELELVWLQARSLPHCCHVKRLTNEPRTVGHRESWYRCQRRTYYSMMARGTCGYRLQKCCRTFIWTWRQVRSCCRPVA